MRILDANAQRAFLFLRMPRVRRKSVIPEARRASDGVLPLLQRSKKTLADRQAYNAQETVWSRGLKECAARARS